MDAEASATHLDVLRAHVARCVRLHLTSRIRVGRVLPHLGAAHGRQLVDCRGCGERRRCVAAGAGETN
eukprot:3765463-Prymnesium_polylepis.2